MGKTSSKSSYSFYVEDETMDTINDLDGISQSEVAREALNNWVDENAVDS